MYTTQGTRLFGKQQCALQDLREFNAMMGTLQHHSITAPSQEALQSYVAWCKKCPPHWNTIGTAMGFAGEHPSQVLTWLSQLRQQGKAGPATLLKQFSLLRAALHHLAQQGADLPPWAHKGTRFPQAIRDQCAIWASEDLHSGAKLPSRRHLFLDGSQVEAYCLHQMQQDLLLPEGATDQNILHALVLRVQSGTNLRSGNLRQDIHWRDVFFRPSQNRFSIDVINTKINAGSGARSLRFNHRKVTKHLDDVLSHHLIQSWWERHHKGRSPEDYFFPYWTKSQFQWSKCMSNEQHNTAVQACAAFHKIGDYVQFTSTSIRRGNALTTEIEVQNLREQRNLTCAWAHKSRVALSNYCPWTVMVQPGPLFTNVDEVEERLLAVASDRMIG